MRALLHVVKRIADIAVAEFVDPQRLRGVWADGDDPNAFCGVVTGQLGLPAFHTPGKLDNDYT